MLSVKRDDTRSDIRVFRALSDCSSRYVFSVGDLPYAELAAVCEKGGVLKVQAGGDSGVEIKIKNDIVRMRLRNCQGWYAEIRLDAYRCVDAFYAAF